MFHPIPKILESNRYQSWYGSDFLFQIQDRRQTDRQSLSMSRWCRSRDFQEKRHRRKEGSPVPLLWWTTSKDFDKHLFSEVCVWEFSPFFSLHFIFFLFIDFSFWPHSDLDLKQTIEWVSLPKILFQTQFHPMRCLFWWLKFCLPLSIVVSLIEWLSNSRLVTFTFTSNTSQIQSSDLIRYWWSWRIQFLSCFSLSLALALSSIPSSTETLNTSGWSINQHRLHQYH